MKFAVIVYPGSNCDLDAYHAIKDVLGHPVKYIWHEEQDLSGFDVVFIPGGFSYGDYLRCGAIAKFSPITGAILAHAKKGGYIIGVCNGFQILTEMNLLPGALIRNSGLKFICKSVPLSVVNKNTAFTKKIVKEVIMLPVAHGEGNYRIDEDGLKKLYDNEQIAFKYSSAQGVISEEYNINGSLDNIAGILNKDKNILGMMPHPERACEEAISSNHGSMLFKSLLS